MTMLVTTVDNGVVVVVVIVVVVVGGGDGDNDKDEDDADGGGDEGDDGITNGHRRQLHHHQQQPRAHKFTENDVRHVNAVLLEGIHHSGDFFPESCRGEGTTSHATLRVRGDVDFHVGCKCTRPLEVGHGLRAGVGEHDEPDPCIGARLNGLEPVVHGVGTQKKNGASNAMQPRRIFACVSGDVRFAREIETPATGFSHFLDHFPQTDAPACGEALNR